MSIPKSKLETWSHQGAVVTAKATHEAIRKALDEDKFPESVTFNCFLQGSYKNSTNIRGDSDVDLVVELTSTFCSDTSDLTQKEMDSHKKDHIPAQYRWKDFRQDVLRALKDRFGVSQIDEGKKTLKLKQQKSGMLPADIVVCLEHRKYLNYSSQENNHFLKGITFYVPSEERWVVNYPEQHYENGCSKNGNTETGGIYKPFVRVLKNARSFLSNEGKLKRDDAPSYFIECLLFNVPSGEFTANLSDTFMNTLNWISDNLSNTSMFKCQNGILNLFGEEPEQWKPEKAALFVKNVCELWTNWPT